MYVKKELPMVDMVMDNVGDMIDEVAQVVRVGDKTALAIKRPLRPGEIRRSRRTGRYMITIPELNTAYIVSEKAILNVSYLARAMPADRFKPSPIEAGLKKIVNQDVAFHWDIQQLSSSERTYQFFTEGAADDISSSLSKNENLANFQINAIGVALIPEILAFESVDTKYNFISKLRTSVLEIEIEDKKIEKVPGVFIMPPVLNSRIDYWTDGTNHYNNIEVAFRTKSPYVREDVEYRFVQPIKVPADTKKFKLTITFKETFGSDFPKSPTSIYLAVFLYGLAEKKVS